MTEDARRAREGRPAPGWLTEFQARRRVVAFVEAAEAERAVARGRAAEELERAAAAPTFRELAHARLEHVEFVQRAKPSTLRDYRAMLAQPGVPYRRGQGKTRGRIMAALGDTPASEVTAAQIDALHGQARTRRGRRTQRQQAPPGPVRDLQLRPAR